MPLRFAMKKIAFVRNVLMLAGVVASAPLDAQNLNGLWKSDSYGYTFYVLQKNDEISFIAAEDFPYPGYDTMKKGEVIGTGKLHFGTITGTATFFNHVTAQSKCGLPARESIRFSYKVNSNGKYLIGNEMSRKFEVGSCASSIEAKISAYTRLSGHSGACPEISPLPGRTIPVDKYVLHYTDYINTLVGGYNSDAWYKPITHAYSIYSALKDQYGILQSLNVPATLEDSALPLLSEALKQKPQEQWSTQDARIIFNASGVTNVFSKLPMCLGPSGENEQFYELNFYAVEKETCKQLQNYSSMVIKSVRVNGRIGGECESDYMMVDGKPWQTAGKNQLTLTVNSRATSYR